MRLSGVSGYGMVFRWLFIVIALIGLVPVAQADVSLELEVPESSLVLGDEMTVRLKADGAESGATLKLPDIDGLSLRQIGPPGSSSQTIIINGRINRFSGLVFTIGISASRKGLFEVPGIVLSDRGETYQSRPFSVRVVSPDAQSSMKVSLSASHEHLYIDEPLIITLKWYLQDSIQDYRFRFPLLDEKDRLQLQLASEAGTSSTRELSVSGYQIPFQRTNETLDGDSYTLYQVSFRVYPGQPGPFQIPAASVKAMVERGTVLKRDFFDRMVRAPKLQRIFAVSDELTVMVKKLPKEGRPPSFSGAVGQFSIQVSSDTRRARIGDPIELSIGISGEGRLSRIEQPVLNEIPEFKDNFAIVDNLQPGDIQEDRITFRQVVRPRSESVSRIPPIRFSYFDPRQERYVTVESNSIPIRVLPSRKITADDMIVPDRPDKAASGAPLKQRRGIYGNYTFEDALSPQDRQPAWLPLLGIPPLVYLITLFLVRRRQRLSVDQAAVRARSARSRSSKALKEAKRLVSGNSDAFLNGISRALSGYLSDKLNLGAGGVTAYDVRQLAADGHLPRNLADELADHFEHFDRLRFSGRDVSGEERQAILAGVEKSIQTLEKQL